MACVSSKVMNKLSFLITPDSFIPDYLQDGLSKSEEMLLSAFKLDKYKHYMILRSTHLQHFATDFTCDEGFLLSRDAKVSKTVLKKCPAKIAVLRESADLTNGMTREAITFESIEDATAFVTGRRIAMANCFRGYIKLDRQDTFSR